MRFKKGDVTKSYTLTELNGATLYLGDWFVDNGTVDIDVFFDIEVNGG